MRQRRIQVYGGARDGALLGHIILSGGPPSLAERLSEELFDKNTPRRLADAKARRERRRAKRLVS